jgi:hypothetical protein
VVEILGVVKLVPVPREEPPLDTAYQFNTPVAVVAPKVNAPAAHLEAGVVEEIVAAGVQDTVTVDEVTAEQGELVTIAR